MTDTPDLAIDPAAEHDAEAAGCETHSHHGYMKEKDRYKARLKRIEGQVRGIHRMIDEEQYCIDILTQVSAINSALRNVALGLLDDHMRHCTSPTKPQRSSSRKWPTPSPASPAKRCQVGTQEAPARSRAGTSRM